MNPVAAQEKVGLFGPGTLFWKINRENVILLAGPAAAVLQVAHPVVAKGVAAHSRFREDAGGRLSRTLEAVYTVGFGRQDAVELVRAKVGKMHARVRGDGYSASNLDAQLWVIATLVMGSVTIYERFVSKLEESEKSSFLSENRRFAEVFGMPPDALPKDWQEFTKYWNSMLQGNHLATEEICGEVARAVVHPEKPVSMRISRVFFPPLASLLIPPRLMERLGIQCKIRPAALWKTLDFCIPGLLRILPKRLRFSPYYLNAMADLRNAGRR